jgi:hypothetical protein
MIIGEILREDISAECIADCSVPGQDASEAVEYWLAQGMPAIAGIPREMVARYLRGYGAWDDLETADDDVLRQRLLWVVCCDFREDETLDAVYVCG